MLEFGIDCNFKWTVSTFENTIFDFRGAIHSYKVILVKTLDIVLGNKQKLFQVSIVNIALDIMHEKLRKFEPRSILLTIATITIKMYFFRSGKLL